MEKQSTVDDIIAMLDESVASGVGHLNVQVDEDADSLKEVEQLGCLDCSKGNLACNIPTLHQGIDDSETE